MYKRQALFFAAAIGIAGLPPLSGFPGKLAILQATRYSADTLLIWTTILVTTLLAIYGLSRAGSMVFWRAYEHGTDPARLELPHDAQRPLPPKVEPDEPVQDVADAASPALALTAAGALVAGMVLLTVLAGPVMDYAQATARQLADPMPYIEAVLVRQEGTK